jgi:hypothetical protein
MPGRAQCGGSASDIPLAGDRRLPQLSSDVIRGLSDELLVPGGVTSYKGGPLNGLVAGICAMGGEGLEPPASCL